MQFNNDFISEILQRLGYGNNGSNNQNTGNSSYCKVDTTFGAESNCCRDVNLDIPGGFQDVNPILFITLGEIIGNYISKELPINVSAAVSNYLNLIGQIIETYSSQQLYFQNGPGRYYSYIYRNVGNPFTSCVQENDDQEKISSINKRLEKIEQDINKLKESKNIDTDNLESEKGSEDTQNK